MYYWFSKIGILSESGLVNRIVNRISKEPAFEKDEQVVLKSDGSDVYFIGKTAVFAVKK